MRVTQACSTMLVLAVGGNHSVEMHQFLACHTSVWWLGVMGLKTWRLGISGTNNDLFCGHISIYKYMTCFWCLNLYIYHIIPSSLGMLNRFLYTDMKFKVQNYRGLAIPKSHENFMKMCYLFLRDSARILIFSCNQAALWARLSVHLSVHMSRPSFGQWWLLCLNWYHISQGQMSWNTSIRSSDNDSTRFWPPGSLHTLGADGHI